jgi:hypothetical protein
MHQIVAAVTLIDKLQQDITCILLLFAVDFPDTNHSKAILCALKEAHPNIT